MNRTAPVPVYVKLLLKIYICIPASVNMYTDEYVNSFVF